MVDPYEQGKLILSFVAERRLARNGADASVAIGPTLAQRALAAGGNALISLGTWLTAQSQYETPHPTVAVHIMEAK